MRFCFPYNRACPNERVTVEDHGTSEPACLVEFADGMTVISALRRKKETIALDITIAARHWRLVHGLG